jgi:hypothetical protein
MDTKTQTGRLGSSLVFVRQTQTNVLVKGAAESSDYVASSVVTVQIYSTSIRILTGEWKVPGENPAKCSFFSVTNAKWNNPCSNTSLCCERPSETRQGDCYEIT